MMMMMLLPLLLQRRELCSLNHYVPSRMTSSIIVKVAQIKQKVFVLMLVDEQPSLLGE